MIITCENCNKKFEINDDLIPKRGRLLQCGSCDHQWFFNKVTKDKISSLEPSIDIPNAQGIHEAESTQEIQIKKAKQTNPIIQNQLRKPHYTLEIPNQTTNLNYQTYNYQTTIPNQRTKHTLPNQHTSPIIHNHIYKTNIQFAFA